MNTRWLKGLVGGGALAFAALVGCSTEQQSPPCVVANSTFLVKFTPVDPAADACGLPTTQTMGAFKGIDDPQGTTGVVALRLEEVAGENFAQPGDPATALGVFTQNFPDNDNICRLQGREGAPVRSQATVGTDTVSYEFQDVQVYVTAGSPGQQIKGRVVYTKGACSATFDMFGIAPAHECAEELDCSPEPDLDAGLPVGSGINPGFDVVCSAESGFCEPTFNDFQQL